ncbi:MAG: PDZ domain-containing protein, partial [Halieaceae bacterium]|nr:PDZ domain-containing protein [Halieaceae bacterium]
KAGLSGAYRNARGEIILGDIITHMDDKPMRSNDDYLSLLEKHQPGDSVTIKVLRGTDSISLDVELAESQ